MQNSPTLWHVVALNTVGTGPKHSTFLSAKKKGIVWHIKKQYSEDYLEKLESFVEQLDSFNMVVVVIEGFWRCFNAKIYLKDVHKSCIRFEALKLRSKLWLGQKLTHSICWL